MAQAGYTPISLYYSTTASVVPIAANLVPGELAINIADGKLYFENSSGVVTLLASSAGAGGTFAAPVVIEGTTTSAALRITQLGTGNALLVEDSTNPDASPFVIDATGNVGIGLTAPASGRILDIVQNSGPGVIQLTSYRAAAGQSTFSTRFARGTTSAPTIVLNGDTIGVWDAYPYTGSDFSLQTAQIQYQVTGTVTSSSIPTSILFSTDAAGSAFSFERMRITDTGSVGIGTTTPSAMLQVAGNSSTSAIKVPNIEEVATVSATAATGTINYDITTQSVLYYTSNASANWTVNFRGSSGTSLNTLMATGESISVTFLVTQGTTAYYNSAVQVDGSSVTPKWQGGSAPTSGNASSIDSYTYVIIKTGSAAFTVLASQTKFA